MKPYGLGVIEYPDVGDLQEMGAPSAAGGRNYCRNAAAKARTRRTWKRLARKAGRDECKRTDD